MNKMLFVLFLFILFVENGGSVIVTTKIGKIRGSEELTIKNNKYFAFKGIKYAKSPTGPFRFKAPVAVEKYEVYDATVDGPVCPQFHVSTNKIIGNEDCLSLCVYSKNLEGKSEVFVFLHGGGFSSGSSHSLQYGPDLLLDNDNFVIITLNYRLHVFGFLSTDSDAARGNFGLMDQIMALRWVKDHVAAFGGDPNKVTLIGEGAGSASATLLTLSPKAEGLFGKVIALGGTPLNSQYFQMNPVESARELVSRFSCTYQDFDELVECLRQQSTQDLVTQVNNMFSFFSFPRWFSPSVDGEVLPGKPIDLLREGKVAKVPVLTGIARHEGAFYYPLTINSFSDGKYEGNFLDERLPRLLPIISEFETRLFPIAKAIKKRYFNNIDIENEDEFRPRYVEMLTDLLYTRYTSEYAGLLSNHSVPVFVYLLDYRGSHSILDVIGDTDLKLVSHGDTLQYLFSEVLGDGVTLPSDDLQFATQTFIPLITNFAKFSNPTPKKEGGFQCPKFSHSDQSVCLVNKQLSTLKDFRTNILKFWQDLQNLGKTKDEL